jgi:hypothetical protein
VLHVAARITRGARQTRVRIDQAWPSGWRSPSARSGGTSRSCGTSATASSPTQGRGAATGSAGGAKVPPLSLDDVLFCLQVSWDRACASGSSTFGVCGGGR